MTADRLAEMEGALARFGAKYGFDEVHAQQVARLADQLAERLAPLHDLGPDDRSLLRHAALVHDVGHFVGRRGHHRHSAYLIAADRLLDDYPHAARERLAWLAGAHRKRLPEPPRRWSREEVERCTQAAALLRLADGLDGSRAGTATVTACEIGRKAVVVAVGGLDLPALCPTLHRKARLFARVFGRDASFVPASEIATRAGP